jgi:hypothetical protein
MADDEAPILDQGVAPYLVAMLLCDQIITEAQTNKKSLIGTFDTVFWPGQPVLIPVAVYAKLTDAEGRYQFRIDYVHAATEQRLARGSLDPPVEITDRLGFYELAVRMPVPIQDIGTYEFRLLANDSYIGRAVLAVRPPSPTGE